MTLLQRLMSRVCRDPTGCWIWEGGESKGYGQIGTGLRSKGTFSLDYVHRVSYRLHRGEIPEGQFVLHECDTPLCVRPDHLFLGTQTDNMADMVRKGRHVPAGLKGEDHPGSKLTEFQVGNIRKRYAGGGILQRELAEEYGVGQVQINYPDGVQVVCEIFRVPVTAKIAEVFERKIREALAEVYPDVSIRGLWVHRGTGKGTGRT